jgi:hypothetical protein
VKGKNVAELTDVVGNRIVRKTFSEETELSVQNLDTGVYIVRVTAAEGSVSKKVVVR